MHIPKTPGNALVRDVASRAARLMFNTPKLAQHYLLQPLLTPIMAVMDPPAVHVASSAPATWDNNSNSQANPDQTAASSPELSADPPEVSSEEQVEHCVGDIQLLLVQAHANDNIVASLAQAIPPLLQLLVFTTRSKSFLRQPVHDISSTYFKIVHEDKAVKQLFEYIISTVNLSINEEEFVGVSKPMFAPGEHGGVVVKIEPLTSHISERLFASEFSTDDDLRTAPHNVRLNEDDKEESPAGL